VFWKGANNPLSVWGPVRVDGCRFSARLALAKGP